MVIVISNNLNRSICRYDEMKKNYSVIYIVVVILNNLYFDIYCCCDIKRCLLQYVSFLRYRLIYIAINITIVKLNDLYCDIYYDINYLISLLQY